MTVTFWTGSFAGSVPADPPLGCRPAAGSCRRDGRPLVRTTAPDQGLRPGPAGTSVVLAVPTASVGKHVASRGTALLPAAGGDFASAEWAASSCILHEGLERGAHQGLSAQTAATSKCLGSEPNPTHRVQDSRRSSLQVRLPSAPAGARAYDQPNIPGRGGSEIR